MEFGWSGPPAVGTPVGLVLPALPHANWRCALHVSLQVWSPHTSSRLVGLPLRRTWKRRSRTPVVRHNAAAQAITTPLLNGAAFMMFRELTGMALAPLILAGIVILSIVTRISQSWLSLRTFPGAPRGLGGRAPHGASLRLVLRGLERRLLAAGKIIRVHGAGRFGLGCGLHATSQPGRN